MLRSVGFAVVLLFSLPLPATPGGGLGAAPEPPTPPVFTTAVEVVRLDVLVLDEAGRPVTGLTRDDFEVEEGGRTQEITSFEPIIVRADRAAQKEPLRLSPSRLRAPSEGRVIYIYVDDIHVQPSSLPRMRKAIRSFLETGVREGDWVTVFAPEQELWWTARNGWEYGQLAAVVERIKGQGSGDTYADWAMVRGARGGLARRRRPARGVRRRVGGRFRWPARRHPGRRAGPTDEPVAGVGKSNPTLEGEQAVALVKRRTGMTLGGLKQAVDSLLGSPRAQVPRARLGGLPPPAQDAGLQRADRHRPPGQRRHPLHRPSRPRDRHRRRVDAHRRGAARHERDAGNGARPAAARHRGHRPGDGRPRLRPVRRREGAAPRGRRVGLVLPRRLHALGRRGPARGRSRSASAARG